MSSHHDSSSWSSRKRRSDENTNRHVTTSATTPPSDGYKRGRSEVSFPSSTTPFPLPPSSLSSSIMPFPALPISILPIPLVPHEPGLPDYELEPSRYIQHLQQLQHIRTMVGQSQTIPHSDRVQVMDKILSVTHLLNRSSTSWPQRNPFMAILILFPQSLADQVAESEWFLSIMEKWLTILITELAMKITDRNSVEGESLASLLAVLNYLPLPYPIHAPSPSSIKLNYAINNIQRNFSGTWMASQAQGMTVVL
jgi:hypothetical protein